jgi:hypothetical protein
VRGDPGEDAADTETVERVGDGRRVQPGEPAHHVFVAARLAPAGGEFACHGMRDPVRPARAAHVVREGRPARRDRADRGPQLVAGHRQVQVIEHLGDGEDHRHGVGAVLSGRAGALPCTGSK